MDTTQMGKASINCFFVRLLSLIMHHGRIAPEKRNETRTKIVMQYQSPDVR